MKNWRSDWFLVGALCGGISSVCKTFVNLAFYKSKLANVHFVDSFSSAQKERDPKPYQNGRDTIKDIFALN